ncbi:ankyrin repeat domain-containing protein [Candidatus Babeliales bacterium]|nr:ankyrin repeat domain-containing protein [Candidatus Babeliales bacterium]
MIKKLSSFFFALVLTSNAMPAACSSSTQQPSADDSSSSPRIDNRTLNLEFVKAFHSKASCEEILALIAAGADVNCYYNGSTCLHYAANNGMADHLSLLLRNRANPELRSATLLRTPLHEAVSSLHLECVKRLVQHGADLNAREHSGGTPLHFAVMSSSVERENPKIEQLKINIINMLIYKRFSQSVGSSTDSITEKNNINLDAQNMFGHTALHVAYLSGYKNIAQVLLQAGANPRIPDIFGQTVAR